MFRLLRLLFGFLLRCARSRRDLLLENLALRQQLAVLNQRRQRPSLSRIDKLFWIAIRRVWTQWKQSLLIVTPETVVRWHREGFLKYWRWRSRGERGRKRVSREVRRLIFQMSAENPTWGAPRLHGELLKLGFDVSERTVSRWMQCAPRKPDANASIRAHLRPRQRSSQTQRKPMLTRAHWTQIPQSLAITEERDWPFSAFLTAMGDLHHFGQATEKPLRAHSNPIAPPHPPRQRLP